MAKTSVNITPKRAMLRKLKTKLSKAPICLTGPVAFRVKTSGADFFSKPPPDKKI